MTPHSANSQSRSSDNALWIAFTEATDDKIFFQAWLGLLSLRINRSVRSVLVLGEPDNGPYRPVNYWPEGQGGSSVLAELAEQSLEERQGMAGQLDETGQRFGVAYPVIIDGLLHGVVAVEISGASVSAILEQSLKQLRWGCGWLEARLRFHKYSQEKERYQRLTAAMELIVSALEQDNYQAAVKAVVTELADKLNCDRVSIGYRKDSTMQVEAISHSVELIKKMNLVHAIAQAMDEAFDQRQLLCFPVTDDHDYILKMHEALAKQSNAQAILTIPLYVSDKPVGAIIFERSNKQLFDETDIGLCLTVATVIAPILHEKKLNERGIPERVIDSVRNSVKQFLGPEHYLYKAAGLFLVLFVMVICLIDGEFRVKADTVLEGKIQRSIVSPFDSYIIDANARAGDTVKAGQLLARLEDKDFQLERLSLLGEYGQLKKQYDEAMALRDRAKVNIISAQLAQAKAELELIEDKLAKTQVTAPFNGLIIQGDLTQKLGNSVAQGDLLFIMAPLNEYRLILQVNERDINYLQKGMTGHLVLASLPDQILEFIIDRITPVSEAKDGENFFRVEGSLEQILPQLRPGMEGIAKVDAGNASLIWIWSHDMVEWFKIEMWRWLP